MTLALNSYCQLRIKSPNLLMTFMTFLDISKGFDKVWHKSLISKLKQNGISGNLLSALPEFLNLIKQWCWMVNCLYGPILIRRTTRVSLGPLLFLIYISDLSEDLTTNTRLFADDVSFFSVVDINLSATKLNSDLMENRQLNGE